MTNASNIIYYIFNKMIVLLFDTFELYTNASLGWIMVSIVIISIMATNILSAARSSQSHNFGNNNLSIDELHAKAKSRASNYYNFYEKRK